MSRKRIAIIGAGPIGLEAGLLARQRGHDVTILERGRVAENVRAWGHVLLFSPFELNSSPWGREALAEYPLPASEDFLTGAEHFERYLLPLCQHALLAGCIRESTEVAGITRDGLWKNDAIGSPSRADSPFRLLLRSASGVQENMSADVVLDCSGTYGNHNWIGSGGVAACGECDTDLIEYKLPDILGVDRDRFVNRTTLIVGSGYSAATAVVALAELASQSKATHVVWLTRSDQTPPLAAIADDPLPERDRLTNTANALAASADGPVRWLKSARVARIESGQSGCRVTVNCRDGEADEFVVDRILGLVGYRPDRNLYEELQVHECYATQGPIRLAAALLGETSQDCLTQSDKGADVLRNPEPDFFILGAKSYGRDSRFLLKTGFTQVESVIDMIGTRAGG